MKESRWLEDWAEIIAVRCPPDRHANARAYARKGNVVDYRISEGLIEGNVVGQRPYSASVTIKKLDEAAWDLVVTQLANDPRELGIVTGGQLSAELHETLRPAAAEVTGHCTCGDWASMCTHAAALLYVVLRRAENEPTVLLTLRGRNRESLIRDVWARRGGASTSTAAQPEPQDDFWLGSSLEEFDFGLTKVEPDELMIKRLGPIGPWADVQETEQLLAPVWERISHGALELAARLPAFKDLLAATSHRTAVVETSPEPPPPSPTPEQAGQGPADDARTAIVPASSIEASSPARGLGKTAPTPAAHPGPMPLPTVRPLKRSAAQPAGAGAMSSSQPAPKLEPPNTRTPVGRPAAPTVPQRPGRRAESVRALASPEQTGAASRATSPQPTAHISPAVLAGLTRSQRKGLRIARDMPLSEVVYCVANDVDIPTARRELKFLCDAGLLTRSGRGLEMRFLAVKLKLGG